MKITHDLHFIYECYGQNFLKVCKFTTPKILCKFFQSRGWIIEQDFPTFSTEQNYLNIITLLAQRLPLLEQKRLLLDCYIISSFAKSVKQNRNHPLNDTDKYSFAFLLRYLKKIIRVGDLCLGAHGSLYDKIVSIITDYPKETYYCYSLHSHLGEYVLLKAFNSHAISNYQEQIIDLVLLFKLFTNSDNLSTLRDPANFVEGFYINKLIIKDRAKVNLVATSYFESVSCDSFLGFDIGEYDINNIISIEVIAIMKIPYLEYSFKTSFRVDNKGNTNLTNEIVDMYIKRCLRTHTLLRDSPYPCSMSSAISLNPTIVLSNLFWRLIYRPINDNAVILLEERQNIEPTSFYVLKKLANNCL